MISKKNRDLLRRHWRFDFLTPTSPATLFCLSKKELETTQKIIDTQKLKPTPITDLNRIYHIRTVTEAGRERQAALIYIYNLIRQDHTATQIYLIEQTIKKKTLELHTEPLYFLLKRLELKEQLPKRFQALLKTTAENLRNKQKQRVEKKAAKAGISMLVDFPLKQKRQ